MPPPVATLGQLRTRGERDLISLYMTVVMRKKKKKKKTLSKPSTTKIFINLSNIYQWPCIRVCIVSEYGCVLLLLSNIICSLRFRRSEPPTIRRGRVIRPCVWPVSFTVPQCCSVRAGDAEVLVISDPLKSAMPTD